MCDAARTTLTGKDTAARVRKSLARRYAAEKRFRLYGLLSIVAALTFLLLLLGSIVSKGYTAFVQTQIRLDITFDESVIDPEKTRHPAVLAGATYSRLIRDALETSFPEAATRGAKRARPRPGGGAGPC